MPGPRWPIFTKAAVCRMPDTTYRHAGGRFIGAGNYRHTAVEPLTWALIDGSSTDRHDPYCFNHSDAYNPLVIVKVVR